MARRLHYRVKKEEEGVSLHHFLRQRGYSKSMLIQMKNEGGVDVNGSFHRMVDPLSAGDIIEVAFRTETPVLVPNETLQLTVRYEDEDIVVYEKPDDMLVHPAGRGFDDALGNDFAARYPELTFRPLGRLDRHTTGLCPVAKNRLCAVRLNGAIEKEYYAIVEGRIETEDGSVDAPLIRVPGSIIQRRVDANGKMSRTRFHVESHLQNHTLLRLWLETGRTHQIRVHMAHIGHPLAGDSLYGGSTTHMQRQALHCGKITFIHPVQETETTVHSPLPEDMANFIESMQLL